MKKFTFKKEISDVWSCTENTIIKYEKKKLGIFMVLLKKESKNILFTYKLMLQKLLLQKILIVYGCGQNVNKHLRAKMKQEFGLMKIEKNCLISYIKKIKT